MIRDFFLITCEHGGNRIPSRYRPLFNNQACLLLTHRAYDAGALRMARELSSRLQAPLCASMISRLLIDLNRSITHPRVYSDVTRRAPIAIRDEIRQRYYQGYRDEVELRIGRSIADGLRAIHISCHSFTPDFEGQCRNTDIGLLYDPARSGESALCRRWRAAIKAQMPSLKVRMNYPYAGKSDGLTSFLRRRFAPEWYLGIELEINQIHVLENARHWRRIRQAVTNALCEAVARSPGHDFS